MLSPSCPLCYTFESFVFKKIKIKHEGHEGFHKGHKEFGLFYPPYAQGHSRQANDFLPPSRPFPKVEGVAITIYFYDQFIQYIYLIIILLSSHFPRGGN
jgi:hypothetical protein